MSSYVQDHLDQKITTLQIVQIRKYLSDLGDPWVSLAYLVPYSYVNVRQMRLLYCRGSDRQVSGFSADLCLP